MNPPGVEDCPSPKIHESYQDVVSSGVVGIVVVVGGNVVVVGGNVVVVASVVDFNLINFCCLRRRRRAILSLLFLSALMFAFGECTLLPSTACLLLLAPAG